MSKIKKKIKVNLVIEVDAVKGLNEIANTIEDVVRYELEGGEVECIKVLKISSDEVGVTDFYESGEDYKKGKFYKNEEEYSKLFK